MKSQRTGTVQGTSPIERRSLGHSNTQGRNRGPERDRSSARSQSHESSTAAVGRVIQEPAATARQPPRSCMQGSHLGSRGRAATLMHLSKASASRDREEAGLGEERVLAALHPRPRNRPLCSWQGPHVPDGDLALGGRAESSSVAKRERKDIQSLHRPGTATRGQPRSSSHPFSWG